MYTYIIKKRVQGGDLKENAEILNLSISSRLDTNLELDLELLCCFLSLVLCRSLSHT